MHPHVLPLDPGLTSIHTTHTWFVPGLQSNLSGAHLLSLSSVWHLSSENYLSEVVVFFWEKAPVPWLCSETAEDRKYDLFLHHSNDTSGLSLTSSSPPSFACVWLYQKQESYPSLATHCFFMLNTRFFY